MKTINVTRARANLYRLLEEASETHEPIQITGKKANGVLVSEEDWRAIEETLFLSSVPAVRQSIIDGMKTPVEECAEELDWWNSARVSGWRRETNRKIIRMWTHYEWYVDYLDVDDSEALCATNGWDPMGWYRASIRTLIADIASGGNTDRSEVTVGSQSHGGHNSQIIVYCE